MRRGSSRNVYVDSAKGCEEIGEFSLPTPESMLSTLVGSCCDSSKDNEADCLTFCYENLIRVATMESNCQSQHSRYLFLRSSQEVLIRLTLDFHKANQCFGIQFGRFFNTMVGIPILRSFNNRLHAYTTAIPWGGNILSKHQSVR